MRVRLLRAVLLGAFDRLVGNGNGERSAGDNVAAIVNARPDARLRCSLAELSKGFCIAREEIAKHPCDRDRGAGMGRRVARMVGRGEYRLDIGVKLDRADGPVSEFGVPAGDARVIQSDEWQ